MSKHLLLGSANSDHNWRLPADTNLDEVMETLAVAMRDGYAPTITIEMGDTPLTRGEVVINGKALPYAVVIELPEL